MESENTTLAVRISRYEKKKFENFCKNTGINMSVAINMFVMFVNRENKLPFEIKAGVRNDDLKR
jgi:DNA-damage-inducible protein J